jgi:hypothetical protein
MPAQMADGIDGDLYYSKASRDSNRSAAMPFQMRRY